MRIDDAALAALKARSSPEAIMARLRDSDPGLYAELMAAKAKPRAESPFGLQARDAAGMSLETLVRIGRPAFFVQGDAITYHAAEAAAKTVTDKLQEAEGRLAAVIPLVGRIDVARCANYSFVGTGWLVRPDVLVTNRHVAELIGARDGATYRFHASPRGGEIAPSFDRFHEYQRDQKDAWKIETIIWSHPDRNGPDVALLQLAPRPVDGTRQTYIPLCKTDLEPNKYVATLGYPARGAIEDIPDQEWMDRIYQGIYEFKRIAPGQAQGLGELGLEHDCATLGGNSGSVVIDLESGCAAALHYAGVYRNTNLAVPATLLARLIEERPERPVEVSTSKGETTRDAARPPAAPTASAVASAAVVVADGQATITLPITITVNIGAAVAVAAAAPPPDRPGDPKIDIVEAARRLEASPPTGALAIRPGYRLDQGRLSDRPCLAVFVAPERFAQAQQTAPTRFCGYDVELRPAPIADQLAHEGLSREARAAEIAYDDDARTAADFRFDPIDEDMYLSCHVGPERSWSELENFLGGTTESLVSAIYQFEAKHVADAINAQIAENRSLLLVMAPETLDRAGPTPDGAFNRKQTFADWERRAGAGFRRVVVPVGGGGLVMKSYHIKVTVRDSTGVWLSSGNWTRTSQPIPGKDRGNREWHVVVESRSLARFFAAHIRADFTFSENARRTESPADALEIDMPIFAGPALAPERAPSKLFEPKIIDGRVKLRPLLTPDRRGKVYCEAVTELIKSARRRLLFQNQYIDVSYKSAGLFSDLVDALIAKSKEVEVRIILRSGGDSLRENLEELKRRGLDVTTCVKRLANTHTKGIVVDDARVLIGSQNWSNLGVTLNRDASLIIDNAEVAAYFAEVFEVDWDRALACDFAEFAPEQAPRLAQGGSAPPGFRRLRLQEYESA